MQRLIYLIGYRFPYRGVNFRSSAMVTTVRFQSWTGFSGRGVGFFFATRVVLGFGPPPRPPVRPAPLAPPWVVLVVIAIYIKHDTLVVSTGKVLEHIKHCKPLTAAANCNYYLTFKSYHFCCTNRLGSHVLYTKALMSTYSYWYKHAYNRTYLIILYSQSYLHSYGRRRPLTGIHFVGLIFSLSLNVRDVQIPQTNALIPTCKTPNPGDLTVSIHIR
jgi:hypothetical protein